MAFFEALPGVVVSFDVHQEDEPTYGVVVLATAKVVARTLVRDAGEARNVEITLKTDSAQVEQFLNDLRNEPLPNGAHVRVDRRH